MFLSVVKTEFKKDLDPPNENILVVSHFLNLLLTPFLNQMFHDLRNEKWGFLKISFATKET